MVAVFSSKQEKVWRPFVLHISLVILLFDIGLFIALFLGNKEIYSHETLARARLSFYNIVLTRRWNSNYKGVYVDKTEGMTSNPYLENPDIESIDGKIYTKKNPALMTREISEISVREGIFSFRIMSAQPLNPNNIPDEFERIGLTLFEQGKTEYYNEVEENGKTFFRYIAPLYTEESCLACHGKQGYQIGSIRGGISITFNITDLKRKMARNTYVRIAMGLVTLFLLLFIIYFFVLRLMKKVVELDGLKNKFLGMAAHDLRNPLSSIGGLSQLILDEELGTVPEDQKEFLKMINETSEEMLVIVNDLLDISVIESGHFDLDLRKGSLGAQVSDRIRINQIIADKKNITVQLDLQDTPEIMFDHNRINQVLDNLLGNAIKFSKSDQSIYVSLSKHNDTVTVSVRDEGPGISEEDQKKLFGEFQKLSAQPTGNEKSTGLGLAIVKKIIEAHEGTIEVTSHLGEGTAFSFTLPVG